MSGKAFVYTRISQNRSGDNLGVKRQEEVCREYALSHGLEVVQVFSDNDVSAYSSKPRPAYHAMLQRLEAREVDAVICWRMDRLHRRPIELEEYADVCRGKRNQEPILTYAATGGGKIDLASADGLLRAGIMGQVARFESATKSERAKAKAQQKAAAGEWKGGARPFGWDVEGKGLKLNERESAALAAAHYDVLNGRSMGSIVRDWNENGWEGEPLLTTAGKPWGYSQLRQALLRPRNAGLYEHNGQIITRDTELLPPIVKEEVWRGVRSILQDPSRRRSQTNKAVHLLAGIAQCPCGTPTKSATVSGRNGEKNVVYRCSVQGRGHVGKRKTYVDTVALLWVYRSIFFGLQTTADSPEAKARAVELRAELKALDMREREAGTALADGTLTLAQVVAFNEQIASRREVLEAEMTRLGKTRRAVGPLKDSGKEVGEADRQFTEWLAQSIDDKRDYIRSNFHVILRPHFKGSPRVFDPDTVSVYPRDSMDGQAMLTRAQIEALPEATIGTDPKGVFDTFAERWERFGVGR